MKPFEETITEEEYDRFEEDFSNKNYVPWVEKYPTEIYPIFASMLEYSSNVTREDIEYFQKLGVDINMICKLYLGNSRDNNLLKYACEYHDINLIEAAIQSGADVNHDTNGNTPLSSLLQGHNPSYMRNKNNILRGIKLLESKGLRKILPNFIIENADKYDESVRIFILSCCPID